MTAAVFHQNGCECAVDIVGHAGYGNPDIVCSACSVLACTLMQCILSEEANGGVSVLSTTYSNGDVRLCFTASPHAKVRVAAIVDTIKTGFMMLAAEYPSNVKMSEITGEK